MKDQHSTRCLSLVLSTIRYGMVAFGVLAFSSWARTDDAIWKAYQTTALQAEVDDDPILAERAWRAAVEELSQAEDTEPRKFASLSHLALAQVQCDRPHAETTLAKANAAAAIIAKNQTLSSSNPVQIADGLRLWANAIQGRNNRYAATRARQFEEAIGKVTTRTIPPVQLAQLTWESSHAQRDVGRLALALRHIDQAIAAFRAAKINYHLLADALAFRALILVELGTPSEASASLSEWMQIDERLESEKSEDRPHAPDFHLILVRQAISQWDWLKAMEELKYFENEDVQHQLTAHTDSKVPPLATLHAVILARIEAAIAQGHTQEAVPLLDSLKRQAVAGTIECGQALVMEASLLMATGQIDASRNRLMEARTQLAASLGDSHPDLIPVLLRQATILCETARFSEAMAATRQAFAILRGTPTIGRPLPAGHPLEVELTTMLARIELRRQHGDEARMFATQAWEMTAIPWQNGGPPTAQSLAILTESEAQTKGSLATTHLESLLALDVSILPPLEQGLVHLHAARAAHLLDRSGEARTLYLSALNSWNSCQTPKSPHPFAATAELGVAILEEIGSGQAGESTRVALDHLRELFGSDSEVARELSSQGNAFFGAGRHREAAWLYELSIQRYKSIEGSDSANAKLVEESLKRAMEMLKP